MRHARLVFTTLFVIIAILSATILQIYSELKIERNQYEDLLKERNENQNALSDLQSRLSQLSQIYTALANSTSPLGKQPFRKNWSLVAGNVSLRLGDTLRLTVEFNKDWFWGVDSIDRLEVSFVNVWSPDLRKGEFAGGKIVAYIDDFLIAQRPIIIPSDPVQYRIPFPPVSRNESVIRESSVSYHFFFENWNFIHAGPPPMKIEFVYTTLQTGNSPVRLNFMELELYVVGSVKIQGYQLPIIGPDRQVVSTSCGG